MPQILVFSEKIDVAAELLTKARELGGLVAAAALGNVNPQDLFAYGAQVAYVSQAPQLAQFNADVYADALAQIAKESGADTVLLGSTKRGKELAGRLAQKLGCGAVTDAQAIGNSDGKLTAERYALGGNTVATDVVTTGCRVIAVLPKTFEAVKSPMSGKIINVDLKLREPRVKVVEVKPKAAATANIESAETLVVVGKGFAKQQDLALAEDLARALHAEVGCTRSLSSDFHWLGEERMIGVSGKKAKPRVTYSVGVSGQIQHTVGILGSKYIVAINKDKSAPIFKLSDYGIVGDLYQVLPKLKDRISKL